MPLCQAHRQRLIARQAVSRNRLSIAPLIQESQSELQVQNQQAVPLLLLERTKRRDPQAPQLQVQLAQAGQQRQSPHQRQAL